MSKLLAVDLGLRTGLALYERPLPGGGAGLQWYRSHNYGSARRLRQAVRGLLGEITGLEYIIIEGGGPLAGIWRREARRRGMEVIVTGAEAWRESFLYPRQQRTGPKAKQSAAQLARRVIEISGAPRPTSLRHDAAEAILIGLWGMLETGWLSALPGGLGA
jgi:hypothetical protein